MENIHTSLIADALNALRTLKNEPSDQTSLTDGRIIYRYDSELIIPEDDMIPVFRLLQIITHESTYLDGGQFEDSTGKIKQSIVPGILKSSERDLNILYFESIFDSGEFSKWLLELEQGIMTTGFAFCFIEKYLRHEDGFLILDIDLHALKKNIEHTANREEAIDLLHMSRLYRTIALFILRHRIPYSTPNGDIAQGGEQMRIRFHEPEKLIAATNIEALVMKEYL